MTKLRDFVKTIFSLSLFMWVVRSGKKSEPAITSNTAGVKDDTVSDTEQFPPAFDDQVPPEPSSAGSGERTVLLSFGVTVVAAVGLVVVYMAGANIQLLAVLFAIALAGLAIGLISYARFGIDNPTVVEDRELMSASSQSQDELARVLRRGSAQFGRRKAVFGMLATALTALGVPIVGLISSLGPQPDSVLGRTAWVRGTRLVDIDGSPVRADRVALDGGLPVFPEFSTDQERSRSQAVLMRVPESIVAREAQAGAIAGGLVAYSRLCTHAGCAVSLFQADSRQPETVHQLMCPCHQSLFDVAQNCAVIAGPAPRPLPQLPIDTDDGGFLVARSDFGEPVGPGYWERG